MTVRFYASNILLKFLQHNLRSDTDPFLQNYNILYYRYFKYHLTNEQVATRIGINTRQYFHSRNKAIEELLNMLLEMENASDIDGDE